MILIGNLNRRDFFVPVVTQYAITLALELQPHMKTPVRRLHDPTRRTLGSICFPIDLTTLGKVTAINYFRYPNQPISYGRL